MRLKIFSAQFEQSFSKNFYIFFVCVELQTTSFRNLIRTEYMRKIYFYESGPETKVWEKMIENVNGKTTSETPWEICEKLNNNPQKIMYKTDNSKILEVIR